MVRKALLQFMKYQEFQYETTFHMHLILFNTTDVNLKPYVIVKI